MEPVFTALKIVLLGALSISEKTTLSNPKGFPGKSSQSDSTLDQANQRTMMQLLERKRGPFQLGESKFCLKFQAKKQKMLLNLVLLQCVNDISMLICQSL